MKTWILNQLNESEVRGRANDLALLLITSRPADQQGAPPVFEEGGRGSGEGAEL